MNVTQQELKMKRFLLATAISVTMTSTGLADIISTVGLTQITAPSVVTGDFLQFSTQHQVIFPEAQGVLLANPLVTDTGTIAAGTFVDSYFMALNIVQAIPNIVNTSVTFSTDVLGIIYKDPADPYGNPQLPFYPLFTASNFLGAPGTSYQLEGAAACGPFCAFETGVVPDMDTAVRNIHMASFHNNYSTPGDFARIVVQAPAPVPGPIVGAGLPGLLTMLGFGWMWWRKRRVNVAFA
jgi:hypothetical protein